MFFPVIQPLAVRLTVGMAICSCLYRSNANVLEDTHKKSVKSK